MIIKKVESNSKKRFCLLKYKKSLLGIVILVVIVFVGANFFFKEDEMVGRIEESQKSDWKIYKNEEYGFELEFPNQWSLYESFEDEKLSVSFYKDQFKQDFPLDYFSNTTHFSIYPNGIAKSGVIGKQMDSPDINSKISEPVANVNNYVLEDDSKSWVTFINFSNPPEKWKSWGFILMRNEIRNYEEKCFNGEQEISIFECNIFEGDSIRRFGEINDRDLEIQKQILESFKLIK